MPQNNDECIIVKIPQTNLNIWFKATNESNKHWDITLENERTNKMEEIAKDIKTETCMWLITDMATNSNKKYKKIRQNKIKEKIQNKIKKLEELDN